MIVVQKYGGTSVGSLERIGEVAKQVIKTINEGKKVVVVVSAMSGVTDRLIGYSEFFTKTPSLRELDILLSSGETITSSLLSIVLNSLGHKSISLSGRRVGITTDDNHTNAKIISIDNSRIKSLLDDGYIVVVAGFQGVSEDDEITTLGRGGSDLTAVAIAGSIQADLCEIYTDVNGVYTTDPKIVKNAKKIDKISYDEMLELASSGAKVLQTRSVEMAKKCNINLITRSSFCHESGTLITNEENIMEKLSVSGIALDKNQAIVSLKKIQNSPCVVAKIFEVLANKNINIDLIVQNVSFDGFLNISFSLLKSELNIAKEALDNLNVAKEIIIDDKIAKISIVGVGIKSHTGVANTAFSAIAKENISIKMISTSEIKISFMVDENEAHSAVLALHNAYELDK